MTGASMIAYIGLGSNLESPQGDRARHLALAVEMLNTAGTVLRASSVYETTPWGVDDDQPDYLNQVVGLQTGLEPSELVRKMLSIETELGRVRTERYGARIIDLDVLLLGDAVVDQPGVQVPHPRLHERAFVLVPLAEIAPDAVHPILGKTASELLSVVDGSTVRRIN